MHPLAAPSGRRHPSHVGCGGVSFTVVASGREFDVRSGRTILPPGWLPADPWAPTHATSDSPPDWRGVASGPITTSEAATVARSLAVGVDPNTSARDVPWAVAVARRDGWFYAACSTMFAAGIFYRLVPGSTMLVVSTHPVAAATALGQAPAADGEYVRAFAAGRANPTSTPIAGVHRLLPGQTLSWRAGDREVSITDWFAPDRLPDPTIVDPQDCIDLYLAAFDAVTADLVRRTPTVAAIISGGLDSTFMAASLVGALPARRVLHGFCHQPLAAGRAGSIGTTDPDGFPLADSMRGWYPGLIHLEALANDDEVHPLDAAAAMSSRSGWTVFSPGNAVWLDDFRRRSNDLGATLRLQSGRGNATYSYDDTHAAGWFLGRGTTLALTSPAPGRDADTGLLEGFRQRAVLPLLRPPAASSGFRDFRGFLHQDPDSPSDGADAAAIRGRAPAYEENREWFLTWLTGRRGSFAGVFNPSESAPALVADPFAARSMIELAAAITPRQWQYSHDSRSPAGRPPPDRASDDVRERGRGGPSTDCWYVVARQPARMERGLEVLAASPIFAGYVDLDRMRSWWTASLAEGPTQPPDPRQLSQALRLVALAEAVDSLPDSAASGPVR